MRYLFDIILFALIIILIHTLYAVGHMIADSRPDSKDGAIQTAYYKCGKTKKTDLYCPIDIKGD